VRVYLSVDMEGIAGVSHPDPTGRKDPGYDRNVALMLGEANAAIECAFAGGAEAVVVNDSHGEMFNLPPADLDPRAVLVQGQKPYSMVEAATHGRFDVALFVGYHARAGHPHGTIAHTYTGKPTLTLLGRRPVPEAGMNALYLGALGVPVGLVTGDDALRDEIADWLPWSEYVVVKRGIGGHSAESVHPSEACARIRAAAETVARRAGAKAAGFEPLVLPTPIEVGIDFQTAIQADWAATMPGAWREGDRGVRYRGADAIEAFRAFVTLMRLGSSIAW